MGAWNVRRIVCKRCGVRVAESLMWKHRRSLLHRRYHEIKRHFERNVLSLARLAARYGVTREWVSQAAERLGYPGRSRQKARTLRKLQSSPKLQKLLEELRAQGVNASPIVSKKAGGNITVPKRRVLVNGRVCTVVKAIVRNERLLTLHYQATYPVDFVLVRMPEYWLVFPADEAPRDTMIVAPHLPRLAAGAGGCRHDWKKYINAWHLLEKA